jgi:hypothetical protein
MRLPLKQDESNKQYIVSTLAVAVLALFLLVFAKPGKFAVHMTEDAEADVEASAEGTSKTTADVIAEAQDKITAVREKMLQSDAALPEERQLLEKELSGLLEELSDEQMTTWVRLSPEVRAAVQKALLELAQELEKDVIAAREAGNEPAVQEAILRAISVGMAARSLERALDSTVQTSSALGAIHEAAAAQRDTAEIVGRLSPEFRSLDE